MSSELEQRAAMALHSTAKATKTTSSSDLRAQHQQGGVSSKSSSAQQFDVKTMQKEAVLSYVKSRQAGGGPSSTSSSPSRHVSGGGGPAAPRSRIIPTQVVSSNAGGIRSAASTSSIPTPYGHGHGQSVSYAARRDAEKSASAEAHLGQLRMHIESRLRITLPEDLPFALQDGVVLCHIANHVKPRAVPSIHVPSPAVPKLNVAKCRRNVENFLLACRKMGVREDLVCSPSDILEPRKQGSVRVAITVNELLTSTVTHPMRATSHHLVQAKSNGHG